MNIEVHQVENRKIAEIQASGTVIHSTEDALNLMGDLYYQGYDGLILHEEQITPAFFDLKRKWLVRSSKNSRTIVFHWS